MTDVFAEDLGKCRPTVTVVFTLKVLWITLITITKKEYAYD
jgi:hypothetical protein